MTASTPGTLRARSVLIAVIFAWANGLRTMSRYTIPGSCTSSTYDPLPRMKRASSLRLIACPMPPTAGVVRGAMESPLPLLRGGVLYGLDDVHVSGAPEQIAGDRVPNVCLTRVACALQERISGHHHPRGAVAAL